MLVAALFVMSLFMLMDLNSFNKAFDVLVPIYSIASLIVLLYFYKLKKNVHLEEDIDDRKFTFSKRAKNLTWKQKFFGQFQKYDRIGLVDFMIFNGAPSFIARSMAGADMIQWIEPQPGDESTIRLRSKGIPAVEGTFIKVFNSKEESDKAEFTEYMEGGKPMKMKLWWKDDEKKLIMELIDSKGYKGYQERCLTPDDDHLHHLARMTNTKGETVEFQTFMKRV